MYIYSIAGFMVWSPTSNPSVFLSLYGLTLLFCFFSCIPPCVVAVQIKALTYISYLPFLPLPPFAQLWHKAGETCGCHCSHGGFYSNNPFEKTILPFLLFWLILLFMFPRTLPCGSFFFYVLVGFI